MDALGVLIAVLRIRRRAAPFHMDVNLMNDRTNAALTALAFGILATSAREAIAADVELTLQEVLAHAEEHSPALAVEKHRARRGDAERTAAAPFFPSNPSFSVGGGPRISDGSAAGDIQAGVTQELEIAGEPGLRRDLANRLADAFDSELASARFDVHRAVHVSFHAALVAADAQKGADDALAYAEQLLSIAAKQVQAGEESALVEKLTRAEVSRAKEQQVAAQQSVRAARLELALVAGFPGGAAIIPKGTLPEPEATASLSALVELARKSQPALRLRRAELEAARAQVALSDREAFPKPVLGVAYVSEALLPPSAATSNIILGTVELPLPVWRQNDGDRARAQVQLSIAQAGEQALLQSLENRIAQAKARVDSDAKRIELHTKEILPAVDENVRLMQQAFALGDAEITAVMLARERLIAERREAVDAYRDYFTALAELEAEVGAEVSAGHSEEGSTP